MAGFEPTIDTSMNTSLIRRRLLALVWVLIVSGVAIGCRNTAKGFGKDVENTGEKIQEKVD
jgi:predicted small secreted protein